MSKSIVMTVAVLIAVACGTGQASAQNIERGKLKSLDVQKKVLVVTVDGKDRELSLTDQTRVLDAQGETLAEKLKDFKAGADINFVAATRDCRDVAQGLRLIRGDQPRPAGAPRLRNDLRKGKLTKIDADKSSVTLDVDGKSLELALVEQTRVQGGRGDTAVERLRSLPKDAPIEFLSADRDGKQVLMAIRSADGQGPGQGRGGTPGQRTSPDHASFKPLTEMGTSQYRGSSGGLYPDGKNERPADHDAAGRKLAELVRPLDADGKPADNGKIVLLSLGMSNTSQVSEGFQSLLRTAEGLHPRFQFVNGAQGGMTAEAIQDPEDGRRGRQFWNTVDERLKQAGVTRSQVQAVWIKQADAGPSQGFPGYPKKLQQELKRIVQVVTQRFPNARLCYLSSRTYGGFATTQLNPEPVAYESGFAVKWLIEEQLEGKRDLNFDPSRGEVKAPWLSWGPYLWANGQTKRADGFSYEPSDFSGDGTHHASAGTRKTGELLLKFLQTDPTTTSWVMKQGSP